MCSQSWEAAVGYCLFWPDVTLRLSHNSAAFWTHLSSRNQELELRAFLFQRALFPSLLFSIFILATEPCFQKFYTEKKEKQRIALVEGEGVRAAGLTCFHHLPPLEAPAGSYWSSYCTKVCWLLLLWTKDTQNVISLAARDENPGEKTRRLLLAYLGTWRVLVPTVLLHLLLTCLLTAGFQVIAPMFKKK